MKAFVGVILLMSLAVFSCKEQSTAPEDKAVMTIGSITANPPIVAKGDLVVLSADINFNGVDAQNDVSYEWYCNEGRFSSTRSQQAVWTAPSALGDCQIDLAVTHAGQSASGSTTVKVVQTPASGYGCVSGFIVDEGGNPIANKTVALGTGESVKTDPKGYFFMENIPQGSNDIDFPDLGYLWAASYNNAMNVIGGHVNHLGKIILYASTAPSILSTKQASGRRIVLSWTPSDLNLYEFIDLYQNDVRIRRYPPTVTADVIQSGGEGYVTFKFKAVPFHGKLSEFSSSASSSFVNAIDPPASTSGFTFQSFFTAVLYWQTMEYEQYLSGYRIAYYGSYYWYFLTSLLPATTHQYTLSTRPGDQTIYYVISIADDGSFNNYQYQSQRLTINTPRLEDVTGLAATVSSSPTKADLRWNRITNHSPWYDGYIIERAEGTGSSMGSFQQIGIVLNIGSELFSDLTAVAGVAYTYRLSAFAVRPQSSDTSRSGGATVEATMP